MDVVYLLTSLTAGNKRAASVSIAATLVASPLARFVDTVAAKLSVAFDEKRAEL